MKQIKFIHCADLHLDRPFVGLRGLPEKIYEQTKQSTFESFTRIVDLALQEQVDFVIIAGDLYDGEDRSIRAQIRFRNEMERLHKQNILVFIVHGNHDHLSGRWTTIEFPDNVFIFPAHVKMIPYTTESGVKIHFYGFSYPKKHVYERMITHYEKVAGADFHIGILHGHDSADKSHYSYAPFNKNELLALDFHYWALGHIHKTKILHSDPYIIYPGNIQGRHRNEDGEKGCYLIEMNEFQTKATFIETAPIIFANEEISIKKFESFDDLFYPITKLKDEWRAKNKNTFLQVVVHVKSGNDELNHWLTDEEFLSLLREGEEHFDPFIWIERIDLLEQNEAYTEPIGDDFYQQVINELEAIDDLHQPLAPLFQHGKAKKFLEALTAEEQIAIKQQARQLLFRLLKG